MDSRLDPSTQHPRLEEITSNNTVGQIQRDSADEFKHLQTIVGIVIVVVILFGLLIAVYVRYHNMYGGKFIALDLLFRLSHFTPAGQQVTAYKSCLGVVFTLCSSLSLSFS
jgi:hypothetical protein